MFLHGGGFEFGSVRSNGELAARLGRASGLAVALLVATRDAGEPMPAAAVLMSPTVDLTSSGPR
jgi:monoterpene epsilon-lactone hydrolase